MSDLPQSENRSRFKSSGAREDLLEALRAAEAGPERRQAAEPLRTKRVEVEPAERPETDVCLLCGKALPFLVKLKKGEFCSPHHQKEYEARTTEDALSRISGFRPARRLAGGAAQRVKVRTGAAAQEEKRSFELPALREAEWTARSAAELCWMDAGKRACRLGGWRPKATCEVGLARVEDGIAAGRDERWEVCWQGQLAMPEEAGRERGGRRPAAAAAWAEWAVGAVAQSSDSVAVQAREGQWREDTAAEALPEAARGAAPRRHVSAAGVCATGWVAVDMAARAGREAEWVSAQSEDGLALAELRRHSVEARVGAARSVELTLAARMDSGLKIESEGRWTGSGEGEPWWPQAVRVERWTGRLRGAEGAAERWVAWKLEEPATREAQWSNAKLEAAVGLAWRGGIGAGIVRAAKWSALSLLAAREGLSEARCPDWLQAAPAEMVPGAVEQRVAAYRGLAKGPIQALVMPGPAPALVEERRPRLDRLRLPGLRVRMPS